LARYAAFLRGINVGGRRVKADALCAPFAELGFDAEHDANERHRGADRREVLQRRLIANFVRLTLVRGLTRPERPG
jgi:phage replication-related protein YjqB (UPF0714/DUF867 family)